MDTTNTSLKTKKHIVIVEDELELRSMYSQLLCELFANRDWDINITFASNGFEADYIFKNGTYDLAILDINLPGPNGNELLTSIRTNESSKSMPVVIVSGYLVHHKSHESDRTLLLEKPLNLRTLKSFVEMSLAA